MSSPPTIITAADARYARCLYQLLLSAERRRLDEGHRFLAYDLGIDAASRQRLEKRFGWCEWRRFPFEAFPAHVGLGRRSYAWKPLLIRETALERGGLLLWVDSATLFRSELSPVWRRVREYSVYVLKGQGAIAERCDPKTLEALGVSADVRGKPERPAGVIGLDCAAPVAGRLLAEWCSQALVPELIAPRDPPLPLHRPEQSLLAILLYRYEADGRLRLTADEIDISSGSPVAWMSSRNKVAPGVPRWADPLVRLYYRSYKAIDQKLWRIKRGGSIFPGWPRRSKEHFSVFVCSRQSGQVREVRSPRARYYADPFVWTHQGVSALFVEEFDYLQDRGRLRCMTIDAQLRAGAAHTIVERSRHASFPFLFQRGQDLYMIPETCHEACIDLYRCEAFPHRWSFARRLLGNLDAADSVLLEHEKRWWLITSLRDHDDAPRYLAVFFADDLLNGEWRAHPVNRRRLYAESPFGAGRNAGTPLRWRDALLRPVQWNARYYGDGVRWMRIETLSEQEYREVPFTDSHGLAQLCARLGPHHVSTHGDLVAWDVRDRVGFGTRLSTLAAESSRLAASGIQRELAEALRCSG